ncbi:MAG: T9SS type A sorting domain-containing protein [Bacteroidota bacterium]
MKKQFVASVLRPVAVIIALGVCFLYTKKTPPTDGQDGYDRPGDAIAFEIERTKDPATGKVPFFELWQAKLATESSKQSSAGRINALSWSERGPNGDINGPSGNSRPNQDQTAGRIRAAMVDSLDPTRKTVWVGSVAGGLWKTTDITATPATWTLVNDFLSNLAIAAICQDPRPGFQNNMYFATGESFGNADAVSGVGVFKSVDAGNTWTYLASTSGFPNGTRIVCDYQGNVYLGTRGQGLQRSTDGGAIWTNITPTGVGTSICDIEISTTDGPGRLHVTSGIFSASGYAFSDAPATATSGSGWAFPTTPFTTFNQRTELAIKGNNLVALPSNGSYQVPTIWKTTDGGDNWAATPGQPTSGWATGQAWYGLSAGFNPNNDQEVIIGGLDNYKTIDGGTTWSKISIWAGTSGQYVHADQHNIQWWDGGNKLMFTCDGGVHFSSNRGSTIRDRNKGLRLKQFYGVAIHPLETNYFLAGAQDNGVHRLNHVGLDSSVEVNGGDGCYTAIDQDEPQYQFGSYVYNVYRRTTNNGQTWSTPVNSQSTGRFVNPWDYDNLNNRLYACNSAGNFLRWENPQTGNTTTVVSVGDFAGQNVSAVHVSPYTANRVYFGMGAGRIVRADDAHTAAPTTTVITPAGATGYVNCIVTGSSDQNLLAIYSNYNINNVWRSTDGGATWTACDGNLPNMPVRWALFHPDSDTRAFIATETGVWDTDLLNGTSTIWEANNTFPNVRTDQIKYRASDRLIAAGTHGRGIFTATVPAPSGYTFSSPAPAVAVCPAPTNMSVTLSTIVAGGFTNPISLSATGNPLGTTVSFSANPISPGSAVTVTLSGTNTLAPGTYNVTVTGVASGATNQTRTISFTIQPGAGPTITGQPAAQSVCSGGPASFSVTATGSYQWQISTDGGVSWTNISGAISSTYNIASATTLMNGNQYRCVVSTPCGSTNSNAASLTVSASTSISQQPQSATVCAGATQGFSVTATGGTLNYQWQRSTDGGLTWPNIGGANASSYLVVGITLAMNGYQYRCIVTGTCPPTTATSAAATLSVTSALSITSQPSNQLICEGSNATFSITATGASAYQWEVSTNGGASFSTISGASTSSYTLVNAQASSSGNLYRCVVSSSCGNATSTPASLTVNTLPLFTSSPQSVTICAGSSNTFTATATGTGVVYQWQLSTTGCAGTWTNIPGANTGSYTVSSVTIGMNGNVYRCIASGACTPDAISDCATLNVVSTTLVSANPNSITVCDGANTSFTVGATGSNVIYQWQINDGSGFVNLSNGGIYSGSTTATLNLSAVTTVMNGYQYRCLVSNPTCTTPSISNAAVLTVNSLPSVGTQPISQTICSGSNVSFQITGAGTGITYQWQVNSGSGFVDLANTPPYTGVNTSQLTITSAAVSLTGNQYRCVVSGACTPNAVSAAATLTVHAPAVVSNSPTTQQICSGSDVTFSVSGNSVATINYQWQVSTDGGSNWSPIPSGTGPSYSISPVSMSLTANQYRCLLSNATCPAQAPSAVATLTVRQQPSVSLSASPITGLLPGQVTTLTATPSAATGGTYSYTWSLNGAPISVTGNSLLVDITKVGAYQTTVRESWPGGLICTASSSVINITALVSDKLFIFPSPNDGNFQVSYYNAGGTNTQRRVMVYDSKGALVFDRKFAITGSYTLIPVNLERASRGIYYVVVGNANGVKLVDGKVHVR